jgi:hypothetical protein
MCDEISHFYDAAEFMAYDFFEKLFNGLEIGLL